MIDDRNIAILAVVLSVVAVGDLIAAFFFLYLFLRSQRDSEPGGERFITKLLGRRSWLLAMMITKSLIVALVFTYFGLLTLRRLLGLPQLDWTPPVSLVLIILLGIIPIAFALAFYLTRRASGMPPPFSNRD